MCGGFFFSLSSLKVALEFIISSCVIMLRHVDQGCLLERIALKKVVISVFRVDLASLKKGCFILIKNALK